MPLNHGTKNVVGGAINMYRTVVDGSNHGPLDRGPLGVVDQPQKLKRRLSEEDVPRHLWLWELASLLYS